MGRDFAFDLLTHFRFRPESEHLTLKDCLITHLSKSLPAALPLHLAFHFLHPSEKYPDSQITSVSWVGKERNHLRFKTSLAAVTSGRKKAPRLLAEGQMEGPHCNKTALWSEHTGAARETTGANWTAVLSGASSPLHLALSRTII